MRKFIYIALLCLNSIAFSQIEKVNIADTEINAEVSFGRLGQDCKGRGVCGFNITTSTINANTVIVFNDNNTINLIVDRHKISRDDEMKIIGEAIDLKLIIEETTFVIDEDFKLEEQTKTTLGFSQIPKGNHKVVINKNTLNIIIKLE